MRRSYGQGNGPTRARTLRMNRRIAEHVRTTDDRDIGIRCGVEVLLGLGEPEWCIDGVAYAPGVRPFRMLAAHWFGRGER